MNSRLESLHAYPFEKLRLLFAGVRPPADQKEINLGIGEPQHRTPSCIIDALQANFHQLGKYPPAAGMPGLRAAISDWHQTRYSGLAVDPDREIIPVAGTREALFAFGQAVLDSADRPVVLLPNPFYQIYEGAAIMAGAEPVYVPTPAENGFLPDWSVVPAEVWSKVKLAYVCSPGNPAGAVINLKGWQDIFEKSDHYGFVIAADECYSEIYRDTPPLGALEAAQRLGRGFQNLVSFNSLSKRSSAPGLRSGFVAGDRDILAKFLLYRTYHGAAPSLLTQAASIPAWQDEEHVRENRAKYQAKFRACQSVVNEVLPTGSPAGGFFLWGKVPGGDDALFAKELFAETGLTTLPGSYLGRETALGNPGAGFLRIALVPEVEVCLEACQRLAMFAKG